jgi:hypothetical protein
LTDREIGRLTLRQYYLLLERQLFAIQREDARFFLLLQALVTKKLNPSEIFPSLGRLRQPNTDNSQLYQIFAMLSGASRESS